MVKKVFLYIIIFICVSGVLLIGDKILFADKKVTNSEIQSNLTTTPVPTNKLPEDLTYLTIGTQQFTVEVADTSEKQEQGLSGRSSIGSDGMLFPFSPPAQSRFWMKDMLFDLDFIWIANNQVVEITQSVPHPSPGVTQDQLPIYQPQQAVDMMLEVEAGFVEQNNIQVGQTVGLGTRD